MIGKDWRDYGITFESKVVVLKDQIAAFFEVSSRTIDNYIENHAEELTGNGYEVLKGKRLKSFKDAVVSQGVDETNFVNLKSAPQLGVFDFRGTE